MIYEAIKEHSNGALHPIKVGELFYLDDNGWITNDSGHSIAMVNSRYANEHFVKTELSKILPEQRFKYKEGDRVVHIGLPWTVLGASTNEGDVVYHLKGDDGTCTFAIESYIKYEDTVEEDVEDMVNHPSHYKQGGIESLDVIEAKLTPEQFNGYLLGNVMKYALRCNYKGALKQDLGKCEFYLNKLVDKLL